MTRLQDIKNRFLPRTLYGRSLMIIVVPVLLMQMIVAFVFIDRHWGSMSDKLVLALSGEIAMLADQIKKAQTADEINRIATDAVRHLEIRVEMETPQEARKPMRRPASLTWYSLENKLQRYLRERLSEPFTILTYPGERWFEVAVNLEDGRKISFLCYKYRLMGAATVMFIVWLIGSSIALMAIAVIFMRNQIRPIRRLAVAAEKLGRGQDVPNFKREGAWEVRQAAQAFLDMRDRIRRQIEQRTAMLAGVSHDLRTPLTRMRLQLAMLKDTPARENLQQDLEEMERMLEGYLTFVRGEGAEDSVMTDLSGPINRIAANAGRQGYRVEVAEDSTRRMIRIRPMAFERALANVVSNACKYAKNVWVTVEGDADAIEIIVDDDGPGIPAEQRDEVFRPFYRLEKSRNPKTGGLGLGLAIAQDIIHAHGGEVLLEDSPKGGLRVVIRLPA